MSGRVPASRKEAVWERDGWKCHYCRSPLAHPSTNPDPLAATVDHVIPRSRNGSNAKINLVASCLRCNRDKADAMPRSKSQAHKTARALHRLIRGNLIYRLKSGQWTFGGNKFIPATIVGKLPIVPAHLSNDGRQAFRVDPKLLPRTASHREG